MALHNREMNFSEYQKKAHETADYPDFWKLIVERLLKEGLVDEFTWCTRTHEAEERFKDIMCNPYYAALGAAGEIGEFCNKIKKVMRDNGGEITPEFREKAEAELGDCLWYIAELATVLKLDLDDVAQYNIAKLKMRKNNGTIHGNGDNR